MLRKTVGCVDFLKHMVVLIPFTMHWLLLVKRLKQIIRMFFSTYPCLTPAMDKIVLLDFDLTRSLPFAAGLTRIKVSQIHNRNLMYV